ncbi:unnamed protein product [Caenorhabditis bovis]|uniref:Uncharacterized protein n=1 Tax=Caenorhabditis bovis TaxID=2654633 RepID=A0A8S1ESI8_9PELO|nr:unnamed protein product [Caenorhabditis bovis]
MFDEKASTTTQKMTLPNVKELAKRFESGAKLEPKPTKRIGKFRIIENSANSSKIFRINALPRRRSSLKRRTKSIGEICSLNSSAQYSEIRKSKSIDFDEKRSNKNNNDNNSNGVFPKFNISQERSDAENQKLTIERKTVEGENNVKQVPLPAPRSKIQNMPANQDVLLYEERCRVSLTIDSSSSSSQAQPSPPPPLPTMPPSKERIRRIPSHLKPTPAPRTSPALMAPSTLPRPKFKSPPPPTMPQTNENFPKIPNIPVPETPAIIDDEDCYEQILTDGPPMSTSMHPYMSTQNDDYAYGTTDFSRPTVSSSQCHRNDDDDEEVFDEATEAEENMMPKVKQRFLSATLQRSSKSGKRVSSVELEKLFRFKSEFQLNISKKVGQLRQKVGEKPSKRTSKCHVSVDLLDTDYSSQMSKKNGSNKLFEDDEHIYGDDWSSEDDDTYQDDRRSSMYRQLEEQLNKAFPDYSNRSQMSSDYESADLIVESRNNDESMTSCVARPAVGHLPLEESWTPSPLQDEPSPEEADYQRKYKLRMLPNEQPLYQHYMLEAREETEEPKEVVAAPKPEALNLEQIALKPATRRESSISSDSGRGADCSTTSASALTSNTSMRRDRLVGASNFGSQRSLWCELAEVKAAGLLETLDDESKLRQEAYFEVITSEASYLLSLNVLITHFMASPQMLGSKSAHSVLSDSDRKHLFSNIFAVRDCSERLLCDLESRLEENLVLDDVCDILLEHFNKHFEVYVKYCSNQVYQDRTLRRLKSDNPAFLTAVQRLEENKQCQGLDMRSFLMLPMQRITRYPLLLYAILDRLDSSDERFKTATAALNASNRVVRECNEGARRMERTEQLLEIDRRLVYKDADLKRIPLVSNSRYLVKRGILTQLVERRTTNILQSRQKARTLHVFLFSDILMITKKKLNGTYVCKDYASRKFVDMQPIEPDNPKIPVGAISALVGRPHLFLCTLMRNARDRQTELLLSAESETDRERWLSAVRPPPSTNPEEKVYAEWDCPQALVVHSYQPSQSDELSLNIGDTINILRKMPDGWLYGERLSDGMGGWFPSSYVQNIINDHTRANNYRQRLRLIQAAAGWHGNVSPSTIGRGGMPLMDRLRRMSNPKTYFQSGTVGL